jgi:WD40 repeat protein
MELVRGIRITDYCAQKNLSTHARLDLFIAVCHAVQHAHQKGIIHRDLKPSNILVTETDGAPSIARREDTDNTEPSNARRSHAFPHAQPKVIDFGIAKATEQKLTDKTLFTQFAQFLGTPAYMSPEQAAMTSLDIDTRSDIYSLGVLLYELLTGTTPFDAQELLKAGFDEMRRIIRETEPERPSTRLTRGSARGPRAHGVGSARGSRAESGGPPDSRSTDRSGVVGGKTGEEIDTRRGDQVNEVFGGPPKTAREPRALPIDPDLDWIVMKCLEKDRARRYETANGLAADLQRHLSNEPVTARPPSASYRFRKMVRRNKTVFVAAGCVAAALVAGLGLLAWSLHREKEAGRRVAAARQLAVGNLYVADMHQAAAALEDGDLGRARRLIEAHRPQAAGKDQRDFAWRLLWQRSRGTDLFTLTGHSSIVRSVKFSPDGTLLATRSADRVVKVWDLTVRQALLSLDNTTALGGFSPDGKHVAVGRPDGSIALVNIETSIFSRSIRCAGELVALLADGKTIATTGRDFVLKLWDLNSGRETFSVPGRGGAVPLGPEFGLAASVTSDGKSLAAIGGPNAGVRVWNLAAQATVQLPAKGHLLCVQISPDGRMVAAGGFDGVRLWHLGEGEPTRLDLNAHPDPVIAVAFSPDGQMLATAGEDQTIKRWDTASGQEIGTHRGHESTVWTVAFSPDGKRLASGGKDELVKLWPVEPKPARAQLTGLWRPVVWSPDSSFLAAGKGGATVQIFDVATLEPRPALAGAQYALACNRQGTAIFVRETTGAIASWDFATQFSRRLFEVQSASETEATTAAVSPNEVLIALGRDSGSIHLVDLPAGKATSLAGHTRAVAAVAFSPDGRFLISGSRDGTVRIWNVEQRQCMDTFSPHPELVTGLAISPDGRLLATGGSDHVIRLWEFPTRRLRTTFVGHRRVVWSLAFSPDGDTLASGSGDRTVRLWSIPLRREVTVLKLYPPVTGDEDDLLFVGFSPDGNNLATLTRYGKFNLLRAASLTETDAAENARPR